MTRPDPRMSAALAGAVDLSALAARAQQARQAPAGAAPTAGGASGGPAGAPAGAPAGGQSANGAPPAVIDVTEATFQTEVLDRSMTTPVVIDFWADWCQPCKQLSPILERLAREAAGAWVLAKVDVEANQRLAQAFRLQSIPTVYAVVGGQPVNGFAGALPEGQIRQWLAESVPAAAGAPANGAAPGAEAAGPALDPRIVAADGALEIGDLAAAEAGYRAVLADTPADPDAAGGLAQVELARRLAGVDPSAAVAAADADPSDVTAQTVAADVELMSGLAEQAYARLVEAVRRSTGDERDAARKHLLALFALAGPDDPAVGAARRALTSALF